MMKRHLFFFISFALFCITASAQVRVVKSADRKISIDLSGMRVANDNASQVFFKTLKNDLGLFGWFAPSQSTGELRLTGSIAPSGGKLKAICQISRTDNSANLFSKSFQMNMTEARRLAHYAADQIVEAITGHKGIASCRIALVGNRTGSKELYFCDADGGNLMQATRDGKIVIGPNWGPDGNSIVYTSFLRGFPDVYRTDLRRGQRKLLASYGGLNTGAALSPNGRELALILSKDGNPELYVKNLRNGHVTRLTTTRRATEASPAWSPDGQQLVYVSDQSGTPQLYIISRHGGRPHRLSSRGSENVAPDWGPNGLVACSSRSGRQYQIAIFNPSTGETRYLPTGNGDWEDPTWAPDGRHLFAARSLHYQSTLYLLDTIRDAPVALIVGNGNWFSPACSPR
jgi:TolB protein